MHRRERCRPSRRACPRPAASQRSPPPSAASPVLIADGHHRYAISRTYRDEVRAATGRTDTDCRTDDDLRRRTGRRAIEHRPDPSSLLWLSADELLSRSATFFAVTDAGRVTPRFAADAIDRGAMCLVRPDGTGAWLTPRPEKFAGRAGARRRIPRTRTGRCIGALATRSTSATNTASRTSRRCSASAMQTSPC